MKLYYPTEEGYNALEERMTGHQEPFALSYLKDWETDVLYNLSHHAEPRSKFAIAYDLKYTSKVIDKLLRDLQDRGLIGSIYR